MGLRPNHRQQVKGRNRRNRHGQMHDEAPKGDASVLHLSRDSLRLRVNRTPRGSMSGKFLLDRIVFRGNGGKKQGGRHAQREQGHAGTAH